MLLPDFIIAGVAKGGTTPLWYNLDKHPEINMMTKSETSIEMNFWGGGKTWEKGLKWYSKRCVKGKINGEKTPLYLQRESSIRGMKRHIPNAKIILCLRNPTDRAYSNFQMNRKAGKVLSFTLKVFKDRYNGDGRYYNRMKKNLLPFYDKSQIHICIMEWMKSNTTEEMKKVFEFLGVSDLNLPRKEVDGVLLRHRSRQEDIQKNKEEKYYRVWSKHKETLGGSLRQEIIGLYRPYNKKLFNFLGYKVKEWNR